MSALFIILVGLMVTLSSEKMLISTRCISGFVPNLIKKSVTVSSLDQDALSTGADLDITPVESKWYSMLEYPVTKQEQWLLMLNPIPWSKSNRYIYRSPAVSHFYGTEYEIWVVLGPVGSTETFGLGRKACYFWGHFFMFSWAKNTHIQLWVGGLLEIPHSAQRLEGQFWFIFKNDF